MKIIRAQSAGFCWGVERAIDIAREFAAKGKRPVFTDGPLIHNHQMMEKLEAEGIEEVGDYQSRSEIVIPEEKKENSVMVVRAHGISPERRKYLRNLGMEFRDATCPDVGIIAGKIRLHAKRGYHTVIFGDPKHPEAIGLMGYTEGRGHVISSQADIDALPDLGSKVVMVSQSTMFMHEFAELAEHLRKSYPETVVINTICGATRERQDDVRFLKEEGAEAIVVIGGHHSANTRKLARLAADQGLPTFHVETIRDLNLDEVGEFDVVGVTAGASTPKFLIDEVCRALEAV